VGIGEVERGRRAISEAQVGDCEASPIGVLFEAAGVKVKPVRNPEVGEIRTSGDVSRRGWKVYNEPDVMSAVPGWCD
jgi:hypothetical protein